MIDTKELNSLTSALNSAMDTIAKNRNTTGTLTVEATITKIVDAGKGIYEVKYLENTFQAVAANADIEYNIDDNVYILIPNGDFEKDKIILSHTSYSKDAYKNYSSDNIFLPLGPNLLNIDEEQRSCNLCTYHSEVKTIVIDGDQFKLLRLMQDSLKDSRWFELKCKIKTAIPQEQRVTTGNYGISLTLPLVNGEIIKVVMDCGNGLEGYPYDYSVYTTQSIKFEIPDNVDLDILESIELECFVESFTQGAGHPDDIFIKDIEIISVLNKEKISMDGYYLFINASDGRMFTGSRGTKTLTPELYYKGKKTTIDDSYYCYWFKENAMVGRGHKSFSPYGGVGWECLNAVKTEDVVDGGSRVNDFQSSLIYIIDGTSFLNNTRYKCVLYKQTGQYENTIYIRNLESPITINMECENLPYHENTGNAVISFKYTDIRQIKGDYSATAYWKRYDNNGAYKEDSELEEPKAFVKLESNELESIYISTITIPLTSLTPNSVVQCTAECNKIIIGTASVAIPITTVSGYSMVIKNGGAFYQYDADGDSPFSLNYNGPLSTVEKIKPLSLQLFKPNGIEFTEDEYQKATIEWQVPVKNTMLKVAGVTTQKDGYYIIKGDFDTTNSLAYTVLDSFNPSYSDNTIYVKVYFGKDIINGNTTITIKKQGASGTNGTKYTAAIVYQVGNSSYGYEEKDDNGKINKCQMIYVKDLDQWYTYNPAQGQLIPVDYGETIGNFDVSFYTDGQVDVYRKVDWSIFEHGISYPGMNEHLVIENDVIKLTKEECGQWIDPTYTFTAILQAKVTKTDERGNSLTDTKESVYAYYPIETTYCEKLDYLSDLIPLLNGGYSEVVYNNDGTNPQWDSSTPFAVDNSISIDVGDLYDYKWDVSGNLVIEEDDYSDNICSNIKPLTRYDNALAKNFVKVGLFPKDSASTLLSQKLKHYKDTLAKDCTNLGYYDRVADASSVFSDFDYDTIRASAEATKEVFKRKTQLLETIQKMLDYLENFKKEVFISKGSDVELNAIYDDICAKLERVKKSYNDCCLIGKTDLTNLKGDKPTLQQLTSKQILYNEIRAYNIIVFTEYQPRWKSMTADSEYETLLNNFINNVYNKLLDYKNDDRWAVLRSPYPVLLLSKKTEQEYAILFEN